MTQFTPRQKLLAPTIWGPDGRELFPRLGGLIPAGSFVRDGREFRELPESRWVLLEGERDFEGRKSAPEWSIREEA